uniref:LRAT domain-containing protein n=1 Tax=Hucho hucho TaxID=62062 RepID=A0A4W5KTT9_9TELE
MVLLFTWPHPVSNTLDIVCSTIDIEYIQLKSTLALMMSCLCTPSLGTPSPMSLCSPAEGPGAGANSMMSVLSDKAKVKKEEIWDVVGHDQWCVNNQLDEKYQVRPICEILREAQAYVDQEMRYCVFRGNCEHFVTDLRYGKAESRQVRQAVETVGMAAMVGFGVLAVAGIAAAIFGGGSKKKKNEEEEYK